MKSIFASRKGRVAKKLSIFVATLSVVMFLVTGYISGEQEAKQVAAAETAQQAENQRPEVGTRVIYGEGTELDADGNPVPQDNSGTPTASASPTSEEDVKTAVTNEVRSQANAFGQAWTTYDYSTPPALESLPGASTSDPMKKTYDSWISGMKSREERSSGKVNSVSINKMDYSGDANVGEGTATVTVSTTSTISNKEVGTSGSQVKKEYVLTMTRDDQTSSNDSDYKWVVTNVSAK